VDHGHSASLHNLVPCDILRSPCICLPFDSRARQAQGDIVVHRHIEEDTPLLHSGDMRACIAVIEIAERLIIERDIPALWRIQPEQQLSDRRLAGPRPAYNECRLSRWDEECYIAQDETIGSRRVSERDIAKIELAVASLRPDLGHTVRARVPVAEFSMQRGGYGRERVTDQGAGPD
jgi:hypothetical protein